MPAEDIIDLTVDLADVNDYPVLDSVGRLYEVAINGVGYMLYDGRDQQFSYQRATVPLDPQRLSTTDTPFSQAINRYSFYSLDDFADGAGQTNAERARSSGDAYKASVNLDPFTVPGSVSLVPSMTATDHRSHATSKVAVAGDKLYATVGTDIDYVSTPGGLKTTIAAVSGGTLLDITSDGTNWYAADGSNIFKGTTSVSATWAGQDAGAVHWAAGRICAAVQVGSTGTYRRFTTLTDAGADEVTNGRLTLQAGWNIDDFTSGQGYVWFSATNGDRGEIWVWVAGSASTPVVAGRLPDGLFPIGIEYAQGNVMVLAKQQGTSDVSLFRCIVGDLGGLTPVFVTDGIEATAAAFTVRKDLVFFSWENMAETSDGGDPKAGAGAYNLSTGGYAKFWNTGADGAVKSMATWQGRFVATVASAGVYLEDTAGYLTYGYLDTSISDGASMLDKIYDELTVQTSSIGTNETVTVKYSTNRAASYTALAAADMDGAGETRRVTEIAVKAASIGLRVTLTGPGTTTPDLEFLQVRFHPHGLADQVLVLPIDCADHVRLLNGAPDALSGPLKGAAKARTLEGLVQSRVKVQDVDWPATATADIYEVESVEVSKWSLPDRHQGSNALRMVAVVTLRRGV